MGEVSDMSNPPRIVVERGIEVGGVIYGCVRKDLKAEAWSFIPVGKYSEDAFEVACALFDKYSGVTTERYIVPEGASHEGEEVTRLATSEEGIAKLGRITTEFLTHQNIGYQPLDK